MNSDTSTDKDDFNIYDKFGNDIPIPPFKKETTDTDLYYNLLANPNKSKVETEKSTSSLHFENDKNNQRVDTDTSSVKNSYKPINRESVRMSHHSTRESDRDSHKSRGSRHSTESSKARYEDVRLSDKTDETNTQGEYKKPVLTGQQLRMKKIEMLRKLCDLKAKGYKLSKEYDFTSSIEEMEYEYDLLKSFVDRRNGIKLYKNTIINLTNLVEFFNDKYDPFGAQLNGWSEHMSVEVDSYDDVLEELYEKYKGAGKSLPPEIKLLILIGFSASAFHFSKKHMSNLPGGTGGTPLGGIQSGIAQKIASMGKQPESRFMSEQELNIKRQREELREQDRIMKEQIRQNAQQTPLRTPNQSTISSAVPIITPIRQEPEANFTNAKASVNFSRQFDPNEFTPGGPPNLLIQNNDPRPTIGNSSVISQNQTVKDVLNRLHNRIADTQDTQDESTINDRLLSDTTASESKKKGRKKKPLMQI